jgi:hypothetical protein
LYACCFF